MKCKDRLKEEVKKMKDRKCGQIVKRKKGMSRQKDVEKDRQIDRQIDRYWERYREEKSRENKVKKKGVTIFCLFLIQV